MWLNDLLAIFLDVGHIFGWGAYSCIRPTILNSMRIYLSLPEAYGEEIESHSEDTRAGGLRRRDLHSHKTWLICTKHRDGQTKYISVAFVADKAIQSVSKPFQNTCHMPNMCQILGYEESRTRSQPPSGNSPGGNGGQHLDTEMMLWESCKRGTGKQRGKAHGPVLRWPGNALCYGGQEMLIWKRNIRTNS